VLPLFVSPMLRVPRVSAVRFWVIVRDAVIFAVMFAVAPAPLAMMPPCQFVLLPQLPAVFAVQLPLVWARRLEMEGMNKIAPIASKTEIRLRRREKIGGLEFIGRQG